MGFEKFDGWDWVTCFYYWEKIGGRGRGEFRFGRFREFVRSFPSSSSFLSSFFLSLWGETDIFIEDGERREETKRARLMKFFLLLFQ